MTCKDDDHLASLLGFVSDHCVVMNLQVPREALEFAGMSINFRSGKFWYSICPIFSKVMLKFSMTFAENRTYGVPEFAGTEVNRHSGKLKGLSRYLQNQI